MFKQKIINILSALPLKFNRLKVFCRENNFNKLTMTAVLVVLLGVGVVLTRNITRLFTRAVGETVSVYFVPSSATLPPSARVSMMLDAKSNRILFTRVVLQYDPAKVNITGSITPGTSLGRAVLVTDTATANATGRAVIVLGTAPSASPPTGIFEVASFSLVAVSGLPNDSSTLNYVSSEMEITEKSEIDLPISVTPVQLVLNPVNPTQTPVPSLTPRPTSTPGPTTGPVPTSVPVPTVPPPGGQTLIFTPTDDAVIYASNPNANAGNGIAVRIDNSPVEHTVMKFTVSGVSGRTVTSAKLRLYNTQVSVFGGSFYKAAGTWTQSSVTWNNAPQISNLITSLGAVGSGKWYEVDMTSYIIADGTYSLRITSNTGDGADYSSREGSNPPQLVVTVSGPTTEPVPTSTPIILPTNYPTSVPVPTVPPPGGQTLTFTPTDDAVIYASNPNANAGNGIAVRIDNSPVEHTVMKFTVSGVSGRTVTSAKLRLYNTQVSVFGGSFYKAAGTWTQSSVTWNNAPQISNLITSLGAVGSGKWYEVDMTSYIIADGTYSLRITSNTGDGADYSSREGSNPPQLVVTLE